MMKRKRGSGSSLQVLLYELSQRPRNVDCGKNLVKNVRLQKATIKSRRVVVLARKIEGKCYFAAPPLQFFFTPCLASFLHTRLSFSSPRVWLPTCVQRPFFTRPIALQQGVQCSRHLFQTNLMKILVFCISANQRKSCRSKKQKMVKWQKKALVKSIYKTSTHPSPQNFTSTCF